jgi:hypothetical protein
MNVNDRGSIELLGRRIDLAIHDKCRMDPVSVEVPDCGCLEIWRLARGRAAIGRAERRRIAQVVVLIINRVVQLEPQTLPSSRGRTPIEIRPAEVIGYVFSGGRNEVGYRIGAVAKLMRSSCRGIPEGCDFRERRFPRQRFFRSARDSSQCVARFARLGALQIATHSKERERRKRTNDCNDDHELDEREAITTMMLEGAHFPVPFCVQGGQQAGFVPCTGGQSTDQ